LLLRVHRGFTLTHYYECTYGQCVNELEWNVYWAAVGSIKQWFNPDSGQRLGDDQVRRSSV